VLRYREDVIHEGEVGGKCRLDQNKLRSKADHKSPLQSWAAELLPFASVEDFAVDQRHCDIIYEKPAILIKLDAGVSMYHHFCDFVNLYASQHLNGSFGRDVHIVMWDTVGKGLIGWSRVATMYAALAPTCCSTVAPLLKSGMHYNDLFGETWKVFTDLPLIHLKDLDHKRVCFREAMMPLLARMQFGMYYNMPMVSLCLSLSLWLVVRNLFLKKISLLNDGMIAR
jgi:EGF domain-specific O-GlcNAc transferase